MSNIKTFFIALIISVAIWSCYLYRSKQDVSDAKYELIMWNWGIKENRDIDNLQSGQIDSLMKDSSAFIAGLEATNLRLTEEENKSKEQYKNIRRNIKNQNERIKKLESDKSFQ